MIYSKTKLHRVISNLKLDYVILYQNLANRAFVGSEKEYVTPSKRPILAAYKYFASVDMRQKTGRLIIRSTI